jgi:hypothetical protein
MSEAHGRSSLAGKTRCIQAMRTTTGSPELKRELALADLIRDMAHAEEARKTLFAKIVRFVQAREAKGPTQDMLEQIRRDQRLCKLLVKYEQESEIIGMMELVRDLKLKPPRRESGRTAITRSSAER